MMNNTDVSVVTGFSQPEVIYSLIFINVIAAFVLLASPRNKRERKRNRIALAIWFGVQVIIGLVMYFGKYL